MKKKIIIASIFVIGALFLGSKSEAYLFGMKSWDNTISNIQQIEEKYAITMPIVSFIFDPWGLHVEHMMNRFNEELWEDRIYHITLSPNMYSAQEVAEGKFDSEYKQFFQDIKKNNLRVVFRTMHEMNGGRYPRSSSPYRFKKAWIHVWDISREEWLTTNNILFDMSVNAWDMPIKKWKPSQNGVFVHCQPNVKTKLKCATFEDYYPGDKYVDLMGITFYNRGKGNSNRRRGTPDQLINTPGWNSLDRLKKFNKPIFVDEMWTTAVNYTWAYDQKKSIDVYQKNMDMKNKRLIQLKEFLLRESKIVWAVYFNVDYTNGLSDWIIGEADRSVIDFRSNKFYTGILDVYETGKPNIYSSLYYLFNVQRVTINNQTHLIKSQYARPVKTLYAEMVKYSNNTSTQLAQLDSIKYTNSLATKYKRFKKEDLDAIVDSTKKFIQE